MEVLRVGCCSGRGVDCLCCEHNDGDLVDLVVLLIAPSTSSYTFQQPHYHIFPEYSSALLLFVFLDEEGMNCIHDFHDIPS